MRAEIEGRPAVGACIGLVLGLVAIEWLPAFVLAALGLVWLRPNSVRAILLCAFAVGAAIAPNEPKVPGSPPGRWIHAIGTVASIPDTHGGRHTSNVRTDSGLYRVTSDVDTALGDVVEFSGSLRPVREGLERAARFRDVVGTVSVRGDAFQIIDRSSPLLRLGSSWKRSFVMFTESVDRAETKQVVRALTFNIDDGLDKEFLHNLQRTGTVHIISASGAHVLIFAVGLAFVLSWLPSPRPVQLILLVCVLSIYAMAAGLRPPIVRAVVMAAMGYGAYLFRREPDLLSALALTLAGYLIWSPDSIHDVGLQLSFATVGSLAIFCRFESSAERRGLQRVLAHANDLIRASGVAWLGSAPLVAYHFGYVSLVSIPANFAIAALIAPIMILSLAAHGLWLIAPAIGVAIMDFVATPLCAALRWIVDTIGGWDLAAIQIPEFPALLATAVYVVALAVWRPRARPA